MRTPELQALAAAETWWLKARSPTTVSAALIDNSTMQVTPRLWRSGADSETAASDAGCLALARLDALRCARQDLAFHADTRIVDFVIAHNDEFRVELNTSWANAVLHTSPLTPGESHSLKRNQMTQEYHVFDTTWILPLSSCQHAGEGNRIREKCRYWSMMRRAGDAARFARKSSSKCDGCNRFQPSTALAQISAPL